ncbi:MAG: flagellar protein export ATPase FliI [Peptococcaceae bacterium]|nr:flagellar protein export ATPase FliI [Peptococcaceae bacterium]
MSTALPAIDLQQMRQRLASARVIKQLGRVTKVVGLTIEVVGIDAFIGEVCDVFVPERPGSVPAEVVGFRDGVSLLMPLGDLSGVRPGSKVEPKGHAMTISVGDYLLGRVLDGLGRPLDGDCTGEGTEMPIFNAPPGPLERRRIKEPLATGIRAIDGFITCGRGQRVGIFAGSGVGKSVTMGMICRYASADVNVVALVGERGREVREFIERDLGMEGLNKSVVVVATSDQPALVRLRAAFVATAIAEYFRDQGRDVLLLMDSLTRFAMAQREVGLTVGEPPATKGYTPSVFALLPVLLERAGTAAKGSITGFYTVLVEGDDMQEPVADTARSILDGHIVLSRDLAAAHHYPAIDILQSTSRLMTEIVSEEHERHAGDLRRLLAAYRQSEDLINIGAYVSGSNPLVDRAIEVYPALMEFLRQQPDETESFEDSVARLSTLAGEA